MKRVGEYIEDNGPLKRFFQGNDGFVQELAQKVVNLEQDPANKLRNQDLSKTIKSSLYQHVIYCGKSSKSKSSAHSSPVSSISPVITPVDDSTSMKREGRWESQKEFVQRITKITTLVLPDGEGVTLRFINRDINNSDNLTLEGLKNILQPMDWQPGGDTPIGTNLRSKILQPLVYSKLEAGTLERPLLIIIMTDGMPEREDRSELENVILECEKKIQDSGYPPQSMSICFLLLSLLPLTIFQ